MARRSITPETGPIRTCIGCRERAAKSELLRVVAGSDSNGQPAVVPDPLATAPGRGAHVHPTIDCYELAVRRRAFARAFGPQAAGGAGLTGAPVGEFITSLKQPTEAQTTRNWSSSS